MENLTIRKGVFIINKIFNYDIKPLSLSSSEKDIFKSVLTNDSLNQLKKIIEIIEEQHAGLHIISGQRGVGKTSLLNLALEINEVETAIKINVLNKDINLLSELLLEFEKYYLKQFTILKNRNDSFTEEDFEELLMLKEILIYDTEKVYQEYNKQIVKESNSKIESNSGVGNLNLESGIPGAFKAKVEIEAKRYSEKNRNAEKLKEIEYSIIRKEIQRYESYKSHFIKWSNNLYEKVNFIIILDELDKLSSEDFDYFLKNNKQLFLEANLQIFIVCDQNKYLNLIEPLVFTEYESYISSSTYISSLNFKSFAPIYYKINMHECIESALSAYYHTTGNMRKIINDSHITFEQREGDWKYGYILYKIEESTFYNQLTGIYRDVVKSYLLVFLKELELHEELDLEFIGELLECYKVLKGYSLTINKLLKTTNQNLKEIGEIYDQEKEVFSVNFIEVKKLEEDRDLLYLIKEIGRRRIKKSSNNKFVIFSQSENSNGAALDILKVYLDLVIVVVLYSDGYNSNNRLLNALIVIDNGVFRFGLDFNGYPGISSHRPEYYKEFIGFLKEKRIKYKDVRNKEISEDREKFFQEAIDGIHD